MVPLIHIRTLADAGVARFARRSAGCRGGPRGLRRGGGRIDTHLTDEMDGWRTSRKQVAEPVAGDSLVLPAEVVGYLDRLRGSGRPSG